MNLLFNKPPKIWPYFLSSAVSVLFSSKAIAIAFSLSHIFSHNAGMQMVDKYGFEFTWNVITVFALIGVVILFWLLLLLKKEKVV